MTYLTASIVNKCVILLDKRVKFKLELIKIMKLNKQEKVNSLLYFSGLCYRVPLGHYLTIHLNKIFIGKLKKKNN